MKMGNRSKGFTLVELVIVVLILGILAAVAAPRLLNTSGKAIDNGLKVTLGTVRDAIELYAADHGALPGQPVDDGNGGTTPADFALALEPYIRGPFPSCPVGGAVTPAGITIVTGDADLTGDAAPTNGWKFNSDTGEFIANFNGVSQVDSLVTYDQF